MHRSVVRGFHPGPFALSVARTGTSDQRRDTSLRSVASCERTHGMRIGRLHGLIIITVFVVEDAYLAVAQIDRKSKHKSIEILSRYRSLSPSSTDHQPSTTVRGLAASALRSPRPGGGGSALPVAQR
ncbi:hypothetical protein [Oryza sativa Japonica Group]|uniref:Uncharacterized protein n=1 Tax=Oryza sativa subsp. japonica TaxID=39947 RepID=Q8LIZ8_ORYSJ|nr:hypothetical protein [Oryza sativa Japonica Group]